MSEYFNQFIDGSLLGDAYITKKGQFCITHSIKQQDYLSHKADILKSNGMKVSTKVDTKLTGFSTNPRIRLSCSKKHLWKPLRDKWYPLGIKIVPEDIELTPIVLAYWFMDDGNANLIGHYTSVTRGRVDFEKKIVNKFRLYTDGFDDKSQNILIEKLFSLNINCGTYLRKKNNKKYLEIRDKKSKQIFKDIVKELIVPSMKYKIDHEVAFSV